MRSEAKLALVLLTLALATLVVAQSPQSVSKAEFLNRLSAAATARDGMPVRYVSSYTRIAFPGGDVPPDTGVCSDEVIRTYRALGVDLQKEVHEDMLRNFAAYPKNWGAKQTDANIDHRRVPNLMVFFARNGEKLPITRNDTDYRPGDIVTWDLRPGLPHIGIVTDLRVAGRARYKVLHNIGYGPKAEDVVFAWKITGHYRYYGPLRSPSRTGN